MACRILILAEHEGGAVRETTFELVALAHRLAGEAGWSAADIKALLIRPARGGGAKGLAAGGAAEVICAEGEAVKEYTSDGLSRVLESVIKAESPDIVLA